MQARKIVLHEQKFVLKAGKNSSICSEFTLLLFAKRKMFFPNRKIISVTKASVLSPPSRFMWIFYGEIFIFWGKHWALLFVAESAATEQQQPSEIWVICLLLSQLKVKYKSRDEENGNSLARPSEYFISFPYMPCHHATSYEENNSVKKAFQWCTKNHNLFRKLGQKVNNLSSSLFSGKLFERWKICKSGLFK